ncbi:MAG TPA: hypothetical protein VHW02_11500 [Rhizomicrobium sp.]|jgi:hypothetical protein|nr:hypothetical protein [Rhizomicrobium sp.]
MSVAVQTGYKGLVLAVHPTARGFGWVLFESPLSPIDWGMASAKQGRNARLISRFERLLRRYEPAVLVLEEFEHGARRIDRVQRLCRSIIHLAACAGMETPVFSRAVVRTCFSSVGAATRYDIAQLVAQHVEPFRLWLPKKRKAWESENPRQSLFDAAALAMTYFAICGSPS